MATCPGRCGCSRACSIRVWHPSVCDCGTSCADPRGPFDHLSDPFIYEIPAAEVTEIIEKEDTDRIIDFDAIAKQLDCTTAVRDAVKASLAAMLDAMIVEGVPTYTAHAVLDRGLTTLATTIKFGVEPAP